MENTQQVQTQIELYWTEALPYHYVAEDSTGQKWLIPADPIGPSCWEKRKPYKGNYSLERVFSFIEKFYQPG